MAYRYGERRQKTLFPQSIDEYIPQDAPVRAYDAFVDALDFVQLGIQIEPDKVGCPQYDPKAMFKLLVYGYSYGVRSSRKLERETHYNLPFARISQILSECEQADQSESSDAASLVKMQEELSDNHKLRAKVTDILNTLKAEDKKSINSTDPNCTKIHGRQGSHAGYNAQTVVDEKHGLIVHSDVVNENNDLHQFAEQIEQAAETLGKKPQAACADSGFSDIDELEKVDNQGIKVIVPSTRQASDKEHGPFDKSNFKYDDESDSYICPTGNILKYRRTNIQKEQKEYWPDSGKVCRNCPNFGLCTKCRRGRKVIRILKEELRQKLERQYEQPDSQEIYKLRKQKVELPFGHIKHNLKVGGFLLRGLPGVRAEMSILSSCFNIARMITLVGVSGLITKFGG